MGKNKTKFKGKGKTTPAKVMTTKELRRQVKDVIRDEDRQEAKEGKESFRVKTLNTMVYNPVTEAFQVFPVSLDPSNHPSFIRHAAGKTYYRIKSARIEFCPDTTLLRAGMMAAGAVNDGLTGATFETMEYTYSHTGTRQVTDKYSVTLGTQFFHPNAGSKYPCSWSSDATHDQPNGVWVTVYNKITENGKEVPGQTSIGIVTVEYHCEVFQPRPFNLASRVELTYVSGTYPDFDGWNMFNSNHRLNLTKSGPAMRLFSLPLGDHSRLPWGSSMKYPPNLWTLTTPCDSEMKLHITTAQLFPNASVDTSAKIKNLVAVPFISAPALSKQQATIKTAGRARVSKIPGFNANGEIGTTHSLLKASTMLQINAQVHSLPNWLNLSKDIGDAVKEFKDHPATACAIIGLGLANTASGLTTAEALGMVSAGMVGALAAKYGTSHPDYASNMASSVTGHATTTPSGGGVSFNNTPGIGGGYPGFSQPVIIPPEEEEARGEEGQFFPYDLSQLTVELSSTDLLGNPIQAGSGPKDYNTSVSLVVRMAATWVQDTAYPEVCTLSAHPGGALWDQAEAYHENGSKLEDLILHHYTDGNHIKYSLTQTGTNKVLPMSNVVISFVFVGKGRIFPLTKSVMTTGTLNDDGNIFPFPGHGAIFGPMPMSSGGLMFAEQCFHGPINLDGDQEIVFRGDGHAPEYDLNKAFDVMITVTADTKYEGVFGNNPETKNESRAHSVSSWIDLHNQ